MEVAWIVLTVVTRRKVAKGSMVERKGKRNKDTKETKRKEIWATKIKDLRRHKGSWLLKR